MRQKVSSLTRYSPKKTNFVHHSPIQVVYPEQQKADYNQFYQNIFSSPRKDVQIQELIDQLLTSYSEDDSVVVISNVKTAAFNSLPSSFIQPIQRLLKSQIHQQVFQQQIPNQQQKEIIPSHHKQQRHSLKKGAKIQKIDLQDEIQKRSRNKQIKTSPREQLQSRNNLSKYRKRRIIPTYQQKRLQNQLNSSMKIKQNIYIVKSPISQQIEKSRKQKIRSNEAKQKTLQTSKQKQTYLSKKFQTCQQNKYQRSKNQKIIKNQNINTNKIDKVSKKYEKSKDSQVQTSELFIPKTIQINLAQQSNDSKILLKQISHDIRWLLSKYSTKD